MRVLALADSTYNWPDDLPQRVSEVDAVFALGDLFRVDLEPLTVAAHVAGVPVYGVYGNHCTPGYLSVLGCHDLTAGDGFPAGFADTPFGRMLGVSGAIRYKPHGDVLFEQDDYHRALDGRPAADIVLTHCPPTGSNDDPNDWAHKGIDALADYCREHRPKHLLHGHVYDAPPTSRFADTMVHYVYGHRFIDLDL